MGLPAQVQKQSEAVRKLYEELNGDSAEQAEEPSVTESEQAAQADPQAEEQAQAEAQEETQERQQAEAPATDSNDDTWEHKYKTLQGMFNAEMARANNERKQLTDRMQQLEQLLAQTQQSAPPAAQAPQPAKLITDEDIDEYGESIDVMRRVTKEENQALIAQLNQLQEHIQRMQGLGPRVEQVAKQQAQTAEQAFWSKLGTIYPEWRAVNDDPKFQQWLLEVDGLTGITRQAYLEDAQRNLDADRVARFFVTWSEANGSTSAPAQAKSETAGRAQGELQKQIAPGRSRNTGAPQTEQEKPTYTPQDIKKFFYDVQHGKYKDRPEERNRIERDIFAAQSEGRIVSS